MRRFVHASVFVLGLVACGPALGQTKTTKDAPRFGWLNNLDAARTQARKTGKPIMLVFRCDP